MKIPYLTKKRVYLDYNATTPPLPEASRKAFKALSCWGNPSSVHQDATQIKSLIWKARQNIAQFIGCHPLEIIFTSGASESNNYALKGMASSVHGERRKEIIISSVEHASLKEPVEFLSQRGFKIHFIPVSQEGKLDEGFFHRVLSEKTLFVSVLGANNETGTLFSLKPLIRATHEKKAFFHSDMVQLLGKESINLHELGLDTASFSGHKFYGLKGSGFLYCRKGLSFPSLIQGGPQERKRRAGTENVFGILSLGEVAKQGKKIQQKTQNLKQLRDIMEQEFQSAFPDIQVISQGVKRLATTSSLIIPHISGETLLINLDLKGFSVSVGSACHSGKLDSSSTLAAMGFTEEEAKSAMRVSLGLGVTKKDIKRFVKTTLQIIQRLRSIKK